MKQIKRNLINCFLGAHILYLSLSTEGSIVSALFGEKILENSLSTLPDKAKSFVVSTLTFFKKKPPIGDDKLLTALE